jgi:nitrite reductase (cytochrome c-552)
MEDKTKKFVLKKAYRYVIVAAFLVCAVALAACAPAATGGGSANNDMGGSDTPMATPDPNEFGVITAASWEEIYPLEYASYEKNATDNWAANNPSGGDDADYNMLKLYPQLPTLYSGMAFSKFYNEPNGHPHSLEDIRATGRVTAASLANCITCKSADFTAQLVANGNAMYSKTFDEVYATISEPISCWNCHENTPEVNGVAYVTATQPFIKNAIGSAIDKDPVKTAAACGQCHNEYYFAPSDKATTNPYTSLANAVPEKMYEYYKTAGANGAMFADYTNPDTGVKQLKAQHPEFETIYGGTMSTMANRGYSCADCHMQPLQGEDGTMYMDHFWTSPLENEEFIATSCNQGAGCHTDLASQVEAWQKTSEAEVNKIGDKLVELTGLLKAAAADYKAAAVAEVGDETKTADISAKLAASVAADAKLGPVALLAREAQFYWDMVMVENSEGAHNPAFSEKYLGMADELVDEALGMMKM